MENKNQILQPQIEELYKYVNHLDEKISRYKKQGWDASLLQRNRDDAMQQINTLKQATK